MGHTTATENELDALRARLADMGIPLFRSTRPTPADDTDVTQLVTRLLHSGDARLGASIPCVLAIRPNALTEDTSLSSTDRARYGFLHFVARGLVASRAPDLERLFGAAPRILPSSAEPTDLPDPAQGFGEAALAAACDRDWPLAGDAIDLFDTWLRILRLEGRSREPARSR